MLKRSASEKILPQMHKKTKDSQNVEKVKRSLSEKIEQQKDKKMKDSQSGKNNRLLIKIVVLGSAGPLRFVVNDNDHVAGVIDTTLKSYAREGRLPLLGSDVNNFLLCPINAGFEGTLAH